ncbi:MAG: HEAT repeat domain-containing protein, partial [Myxococcota bacterium]
AEPLVLSALSRPEMSVKKAAAEALAVLGTYSALPSLVQWLTHHANESFRKSLQTALRNTTGPAMVAILIDALKAETEMRRKELLWDALSGDLTCSTVLRLARSEHPNLQEVVQCCLDKRIRLADGNHHQLAKALHRARLHPPQSQESDPCQDMRLEGFSTETAQQLIALRSHEREPEILSLVRTHLAEWISWLAHTPQHTDAAALLLDATQQLDPKQLDKLLELVERDRSTLQEHTMFHFLQRCLQHNRPSPKQKMKMLSILRAIGPVASSNGLERYNMLKTLEAIRSKQDLETCLLECKMQISPPKSTQNLLFKVFLSSNTITKGNHEYKKLHEDASHWYTWDKSTQEE